MEDLNDKILGSNLASPEWNQVPSEIQNVIEDTGQSLTNADLDQLGKGIANYVGNSNFYTDDNAINNYALTTIPPIQSITAYTDGLALEFIPSQDNTGASQVSVGTLGLVQIRDANDVALVGGEIVAGKRLVLKHDIATGRFLIDANVPAASVITGSITTWPIAAVPIDYLECNGSSELRLDFPDLFNIIGVTYGNVDGTHFNVPDLRGEFIRGFDNTAGNDPDSGSRTNRGDGTTGDDVGTKQLDEFESHTHSGVVGSGQASVTGAPATLFPTPLTTIGLTGGNETRPRNVYMMYIIKF